jgi:phage-related protein
MIFDSGNFWDLSKSYYSEDLNAGGGKYNTYEDFASGIRNDSDLNQFEFSQPFNYIPSYGSSVKIEMARGVVEYGDGYLSINPLLMNNYSIAMDLVFNSRTDDEASEIINYIKGTGAHGVFAFQVNKREDLNNEEAYRSIYSMPPYFVQEFSCKTIDTRQAYPDNNSITALFLNNNVSDFTAHNILEIPSMPEEYRAIISGARASAEFDEKPSYAAQKEVAMRSLTFANAQSRPFYSDDGINDSVYMLDLTFENIDDKKLLKILSFIIERGGTKSFDYELTSPHSGKRRFVCGAVEHLYKFKGVHDVRCKFMEVFK